MIKSKEEFLGYKACTKAYTLNQSALATVIVSEFSETKSSIKF